MSNRSGDWLHLDTTLRNVLDWYVGRGLRRDREARVAALSSALAAYDRNKPETWQGVTHHMWMNDVDIVRLPEIQITLGHGDDFVVDITKHGASGAKPIDKNGHVKRFLSDEDIADNREPLGITNPFASEELT